MSSTIANDGLAARAPSRWSTQRLLGYTNEIGLLIAIAILFIFLSIKASNFATVDSQLNMLRNAAAVGIVAWGTTLVIIAGEIDISLGPAVAFSTVFFAKMADPLGVPLAAVLTVVMATLIGTSAGLARTVFGVPSFIATLGLWSALRGLAQFWSNGLPVPIDDHAFLDFLTSKLWKIHVSTIIMALLFVVFAYLLNKTVYGRSVYTVGGNWKAAYLSGIPVARVRVLLFATTGLLCGLVGLIVAARLQTGSGGAAAGLEFDAIAAVVVGGTVLSGGKGSLVGTALGVYFIQMIGTGLVLLGVNSYFQDVIRGAIIVVAVIANQLLAKQRAKIASRQ